MEAIGNKISALRQTKSGGILIQVSGGSTAADVVWAEVSKIVETDFMIRTPKQQSLVEFRGLDSLTNIDELVDEIVLNADTLREAVKVLNMRKTYGEIQSALVLMSWDNQNMQKTKTLFPMLEIWTRVERVLRPRQKQLLQMLRST